MIPACLSLITAIFNNSTKAINILLKTTSIKSPFFNKKYY